jgi:DNA-binding NtrC family response regulator
VVKAFKFSIREGFMLTKNHLTQINENILLIGKTGTGKSHLSSWIHKHSLRRDFLYFQLNLPSLSKNLFESELFGHKKGSFTGATVDKVGFCELVGRGTLFLDEIGELSLEQQKTLLTLLEERIFYSVGSSHLKHFKGTFIFATNKNLEEEVGRGRFREDLYHRLRSYTYELEEFQNRKDRALILKEEFLKSRIKHGKEKLVMDSKVQEFLREYSFPGNYREVKQIMDYICFISENRVQLADLPRWCLGRGKQNIQNDSYYSALENFEKNFLEKKLQKFQGRINFTAQMIEISKVTLISKVRKYGINTLDYKIKHKSYESSYGI